ncbi:unnamed protein product [Coffea canephora]|uniref:DH200=94 genomic scaffold, scaffold_1821 n=1 Tax=Coffea canephora TaxID=49390 RepID=A0A068VJ26_COFCA|nr:unnamed protein product [Coffea canephora]
MGRDFSQTSTFKINDVVVLNNQQQIIVDQLTGGSSQLDTISIVGKPGIGKTTLVNKVYRDPEVVYYFHIRVMCNVSQVYTKRDLLLEALWHIIELIDNILTMTNEDLGLVIYRAYIRFLF